MVAVGPLAFEGLGDREHRDAIPIASRIAPATRPGHGAGISARPRCHAHTGQGQLVFAAVAGPETPAPQSRGRRPGLPRLGRDQACARGPAMNGLTSLDRQATANVGPHRSAFRQGTLYLMQQAIGRGMPQNAGLFQLERHRPPMGPYPRPLRASGRRSHRSRADVTAGPGFGWFGNGAGPAPRHSLVIAEAA